MASVAIESRIGTRSRKLWEYNSGQGAGSLPVCLPPTDDEIRPLLESLLSTLGADAVMLTLHIDNDDCRPAIVERVGAADLTEAEWAQVAQLAEGADRRVHGAHGDPRDLDYLFCLLERGAWQVLRLSVASPPARSRAVVSLLYGKPASPAPEDLAGVVRQLRPTIEIYLRLWQRNRRQERLTAGFRAAVDAIELGIILIDRSSRVVFANQVASRLKGRGEHLRCNGDRLAATDLRDAVTLQVALNHAIGGNLAADGPHAGRRTAAVIALRSTYTDRSLILYVVPCEEPAVEEGAIAAVVYLLDPHIDLDTQLQPVCKLYGLSPVETRLVSLLTAGASLRETAAAMRIKEQTARSYLKQVFLKTDTKRQADLVRVFLSSLVRTSNSLSVEVVR
ncbi:MAG: helix-turn-helix transcriptional regulator [Allosphingosinicella sp.]